MKIINVLAARAHHSLPGWRAREATRRAWSRIRFGKRIARRGNVSNPTVPERLADAFSIEPDLNEPNSWPAKAALNSLYSSFVHRGSDGQVHSIDAQTRISIEQGKLLYDIVRDLKPERSCEIGLAYGFSTLFILTAIANNGKGRHLAVDPNQTRCWHGIGFEKVKEAGLSHLFELHEETSLTFWPKVLAEMTKFDFIFIDGDHRFDGVMIDIYGAARAISPGGVIALDDMWMPSVRTAVSFLETNLRELWRLPSPVANVALFRRKEADLSRDWDHFAPFKVG